MTAACEPVGTVEIAERCGVSRSAVDAWRARHDTFPAPCYTVGGRPAWEWAEVQAWAVGTNRMALPPEPEPEPGPCAHKFARSQGSSGMIVHKCTLCGATK